jgi:hypothetical protein
MSDHMYWFIQGVGAVVVGIALGVMVTMAVLWTWEGGHGKGKGEDPPADPPEPRPDWDAWLRMLTEEDRAKAPVIPALGVSPAGTGRASTRRSSRASSARFAPKPASISLWCWGPRGEQS